MKRIAALTLILVCLFSLVACNGNATQLGTSKFTIVLPDGYRMSYDNMAEDQVAYFYKDDDSVDFDVYQWKKVGGLTLESEANYYAAAYGTTAEAVTVNGINGYKYVSLEEYEGHTYTVVNYMFEDAKYIVEICFWTIDTAEEYAVVDEIINTLEKK